MTEATTAAAIFCRHCRALIERCPDTYEGHRCNGWRHGEGFHRCAPLLSPAITREHAEPEEDKMAPLIIDADVDCYCDRKDWVRGPLGANGTGVWCDVCGYMAVAVWPDEVTPDD